MDRADKVDSLRQRGNYKQNRDNRSHRPGYIVRSLWGRLVTCGPISNRPHTGFPARPGLSVKPSWRMPLAVRRVFVSRQPGIGVIMEAMKPAAPDVPGTPEFERFDNAVRTVFSVSKKDLLKAEEKWKRDRAKKKRAKKPS